MKRLTERDRNFTKVNAERGTGYPCISTRSQIGAKIGNKTGAQFAVEKRSVHRYLTRPIDLRNRDHQFRDALLLLMYDLLSIGAIGVGLS